MSLAITNAGASRSSRYQVHFITAPRREQRAVERGQALQHVVGHHGAHHVKRGDAGEVGLAESDRSGTPFRAPNRRTPSTTASTPCTLDGHHFEHKIEAAGDALRAVDDRMRGQAVLE